MRFVLALTIGLALPSAPARKSDAVAVGVSGPRYRGEPISLDLKDADLAGVLLSFSRVSRVNVVLDPDVKGSVTVRLHDVPWDQAFDLIARINGYATTREGNVLRVGRPERLR